MIYYHISKEVYPNKGVVPTTPITANYFRGKASKQGLSWVDDALNNAAPGEIGLNRNTCIYMFGDKYHCLRFAAGEDWENVNLTGWHLYTVEAENATRCLMPIVDLMKRFETDKGALGNLAREYWDPDDGFTYYEYLAKTATVVSVQSSGLINGRVEIEMCGLTNRWGDDKRRILHNLNLKIKH